MSASPLVNAAEGWISFEIYFPDPSPHVSLHTFAANARPKRALRIGMAAIDRRNVQEQNQDTKGRIRAVALSFRSDPLRFSWLIETLQAKSLSPENGILASLSHVPEQSGELYRGLWLTRNHELFEFAVLLPRSGEELEIESWRKVTAEATVGEHQPGTGKSFGFLALEVLSETQES